MKFVSSPSGGVYISGLKIKFGSGGSSGGSGGIGLFFITNAITPGIRKPPEYAT